MFGGPHIGIHKDQGEDGKTEWGRVWRNKQGHTTGSCGSLTGCLGGFKKGNKPRKIDVNKSHDVQ
jgi:hypothetical protein